ncbi:DUF2235 domain-containing protein [Reyranella sp.]|uniref:DUF2235 domain-containing protein n=1 Tax=Reyranella sp. TaxID=1929291 RepID=UPI003BAB1E50
MARNIVLCCDGTANEFARDRTNVVKLFHALVHDPDEQATFYHPGVGTMEAVGAVTTTGRKVTKLLGLAIGYGLETDIRDAYVFLMNHFREGDRVFLFGFSRGAYTVRCVSSLLHMYGLIRAGNEPLVPYAIRMMMAITSLRERKRAKGEIDAYFDLAREFKDHFGGPRCRPHFVGVWDTVSSVGWIENPLRLPYTADNPDIAIGRHAVALDERRAFFRTNLWRPSPDGGPSDLKQVWFPGVHCDVGGGYPEAESGLSKGALKWMLDEARAADLRVDAGREALVLGQAGGGYVAPDAKARMHDSLTPPWWPVEFLPKRHYNNKLKKEERRMNLFRYRTIPPGATIHPSAYERSAEYTEGLKRRMQDAGDGAGR